ncbi:hypothetical protein K1719_025259 [Acacia pycnantha]|nr:hypothetical protein K1719_025259 [Acacia pycnantha]
MVSHLPKVLSDHRPISISLGPISQASPHPPRFKFLASWISHPDFQGIVQRIWHSGVDLLSCINTFKVEIQRWNSDVFSGIVKRKRRLLRWINGIQSRLELHLDDPPNDFLIDLEVSLREDLEEVCFQEELLWIQKSSSDWVCLGDRNTNFYHLKSLMRRKRNQVSQLKMPNGTWLKDEDQLYTFARQFFVDLFSLEEPSFTPFPLNGAFPPLASQHRLLLEKQLMMEEILLRMLASLAT